MVFRGSLPHQVLHRLCIIGKFSDKIHIGWTREIKRYLLTKDGLGLGASTLEPGQVKPSRDAPTDYQG